MLVVVRAEIGQRRRVLAHIERRDDVVAHGVPRLRVRERGSERERRHGARPRERKGPVSAPSARLLPRLRGGDRHDSAPFDDARTPDEADQAHGHSDPPGQRRLPRAEEDSQNHDQPDGNDAPLGPRSAQRQRAAYERRDEAREVRQDGRPHEGRRGRSEREKVLPPLDGLHHEHLQSLGVRQPPRGGHGPQGDRPAEQQVACDAENGREPRREAGRATDPGDGHAHGDAAEGRDVSAEVAENRPPRHARGDEHDDEDAEVHVAQAACGHQATALRSARGRSSSRGTVTSGRPAMSERAVLPRSSARSANVRALTGRIA